MGIYRHYILLFWIILQGGLFLGLSQSRSQAELEALLEETAEKKPRTELLNELGELLYNKGAYEECLSYFRQGLTLAESESYYEAKGRSLYGMGRSYQSSKDYTNALIYYLRSENVYQQLQEEGALADLYDQMAYVYQSQEAYLKAISYFEKSYKLRKKRKEKQQMYHTLENIAFCYEVLEDYELAQQKYGLLRDYYRSSRQKTAESLMLEKLSFLSQEQGKYTQTLEYNQSLLRLHESQKSPVGVSNAYNNLGFLYKRLGDTKKASEEFNHALGISPSQAKNRKNEAVLLVNSGVAYTNLNQYNKAKEFYLKALKIWESEENEEEQASVRNYIAANYYISGNNVQALKHVNEAIEIGEQNNYEEVLLTSYNLLARLYQKDKNAKKSQEYQKKYEKLKEKLSEKAAARQQSLLQTQAEMDKKEDELRSLIFEKEHQAEELKRLALESERRQRNLELQEKELALSRQTQILQQEKLKNQLLEQAKVEQLLALTRQKAEADRQKSKADKQKQEIALLQKNKKLQELALKQKEMAAAERKKEIQLLSKQKEIDQATIQRQNIVTTFIAVGLGLLILLAFVLFYSNNQRKRANKVLADKNEEIAAQHLELQEKNDEIQSANEELHQQREEIMAQRDFVEEQREKLSMSNEKLVANEVILEKTIVKLQSSEKALKDQHVQIQNSISAAETIQKAILPYQDKLDETLGDHFILFRPRDVVSGDFYWVNEIDGKIFLAAVDCTGHGVPGAFMSLIGNTILDKIIRVWDIYDPAKILTRLNEEIQVMLQQKETGNNSGMDMGLVVLEKQEGSEQTKVVFAGAKRPLYYINGGEEEVKKMSGSRKSIGGHQNPKTFFEKEELVLQKGSILYLSTDGYTDQNNVMRRKIGAKRMVETIKTNMKLSMKEQQRILEELLDVHQEGTSQRDDILIIGVKL